MTANAPRSLVLEPMDPTRVTTHSDALPPNLEAASEAASEGAPAPTTRALAPLTASTIGRGVRPGTNATVMIEAKDAENAASAQAFEARDAAERAPIDRGLVNRIRREFFARGGSVADRYGVTLDDVLTHLRDANLAHTPGPARVLSYVDDVVLATACVRCHPRAWQDAWAKYENPLIRASHTRLDDGDAVIFTRRFWIDLYAATLKPHMSPHRSVAASLTLATELCDGASEGEHAQSGRSFRLGEYVGVRPLRIWLTDRLLGALETEVVRASQRGAMSPPPGPAGPTGAHGNGNGDLRGGLVFRALRRRARWPRAEVRLRLVD